MKDTTSFSEFERRYPPDRFGEEASDNARVWKLYRDRVTERDEDQIDGWNKTLDILLIFAGLFSAVATAFIIEAYKQLKPDYTEIMAKAFIASLNGTTATESASFSRFSRPLLARCINMLWFLSLTLALVAALLAILAKQWLGEYTSRMRRHIGSHRRWTWRHLVYHNGLEKWGMDAFISTLPLMLHLSLLLFLVGLVTFLTDLDWIIAGLVLALTVAAIVFYAWATVAPLWFGDCPTATPLLRRGRRALWLSQNNFRRRLFSIRESVRHLLNLQSRSAFLFKPAPWNPPAYDEEVLLEGMPARRDATALRWMIISLPAVEEIDVALDAVGSLDPLEHRQEFHPDRNDVDRDVPAVDILCRGPVSIAAVARFQRLCEGSIHGDAAAVSHSIRTLMSLSINRLSRLALPVSQVPVAKGLLRRWASVPTHDLHLLCKTFGASLGNSQCLEIRDAVLAWTADAGPLTGETPFISSSITLSFLPYGYHTAKTATEMGLIYSTLSASIASAVLDPARRRAALTILHDAVALSMQSLSNTVPFDQRISMHTPQQLRFCAMSAIGALWNSSPEDASPEMRRILATNFVRLISTSLGVETLTLEHLPYTRGVLDMARRLGPEDYQAVLELLELIGDYLYRLKQWSKDAGEMTRQLIELYTNPVSCVYNIEMATFLVFRLSHAHRRNIIRTFELSICDSLVNLFLPGAHGEQSAWSTLCNTSPRGTQAMYIVTFAGVLMPYLISLMRRGFDIANLVDELLGDERLFNLICAARFGGSTVNLAQHARKLSHSWWDGTKARLLCLADAEDVNLVPDSLAAAGGNDSIAMSSLLVDFIQEVDAFHECQACSDAFIPDRAAQGTIGSQRYAESFFLTRVYHRARDEIIRMARRGQTPFASNGDHRLPIYASPLVALHEPSTSPTQRLGETGV